MKDHPSIELIGSGGFGSVFLLKQYNPPMVMKENDHCPNSFDQQQELKILKDLMHENIVKYLDQPIDFEWKKNGNLIFMEYCEKGALKHVITNVQINYSIATIIAWGRDIFKALVYLKSKKITHRDIKADNIFVTKDFILKIGDFGVIKMIQSAKATIHTYVGTEFYMMPEIKKRIVLSDENFYKSDVYGAGLVLWEVIERKHFSTEVKTICFSPSDCLKVEKLQNLIIWCSCSKIDVEKRATAVQALEKIAYLEKIFAHCEYLVPPEIRRNQIWLRKPEGLKLARKEEESSILPPDLVLDGSISKGSVDLESFSKNPAIPFNDDPDYLFFQFEILSKIKKSTEFRNFSFQQLEPQTIGANWRTRFEARSTEDCSVNEFRGKLSKEILETIPLNERELIKEMLAIFKRYSKRDWYNGSSIDGDPFNYEKREDLSDQLLTWLRQFASLLAFDFTLQYFCLKFSIHTLHICETSAITSIELLDLLDLSIHNIEEMEHIFSRRPKFMLFYLNDSKYEWCRGFNFIVRKDLGEMRSEERRFVGSVRDRNSENVYAIFDLEMIRRILNEKKDMVIRHSNTKKDKKKIKADPLKEFCNVLFKSPMIGSISRALKKELKDLPKGSQGFKELITNEKTDCRFPKTIYFFDSIPKDIIFSTCNCSPVCPTENFLKSFLNEEEQITYSECSKLNHREFLETHFLFERAFRLIYDWENLILCHSVHLYLVEKLLSEIEKKLDPSFGFYFICLKEKAKSVETLRLLKRDDDADSNRSLKDGIVIGLDINDKFSFLDKTFWFPPEDGYYLWTYVGFTYISLFELGVILHIMAKFLRSSETASDWGWKQDHKRTYLAEMKMAIDGFWENRKIVARSREEKDFFPSTHEKIM